MLSETEKLNALMEHLLTEARRFVNADAGSIYIRDEDHPTEVASGKKGL
jgi:hypothetical protein